MRKIFFILLTGSLYVFGFTATSYSQVKIGPELGFGYSMLTNKSNGNKPTYVGLHGQFGVTAEIKIADALALRPSLLYNVKGCVNADDLYEDGNTTISLSTITLPLTIAFRHEFANSSNFFVGAGPTIGYSISGKVKGDSGSESIKFGSGDDKDLKPIELGINGKVGFQFKSNLYMQFYANVGLNNRSVYTGNGTVFKAHDLWGFGIGYLFGGSGK